MMSVRISPPAASEYASAYGDYILRAISHEDIHAALASQIGELQAALDPLTDAQARFKPGPHEWSIKEIIGHLGDVERVFSYRMFRIARNDGTPLAGFDQDDYVQAADFDSAPLSELLQVFEHMRLANILVIQHLSPEAIERRGTASGCEVSVRALIYMLVGHVDHHLASLREKYMSRL
jgi:hypothetical protein